MGAASLAREAGLTIVTVTVAALVFAGCSSDRREAGAGAEASTSDTGSATTTGASTPELPNVSLKLGRPPRDCNGPTPKEIASFVAPAVGESPVWAAGPVGPHATLELGGRTKWGWRAKVLLLIEPRDEGTVTVRGASADGRKPIWFKTSGRYVLGPTTKLVLDPENPGIPVQHGQWKEWPSTFYIPKAGCYFLEAQWEGGSWRLAFAAGRMQSDA